MKLAIQGVKVGMMGPLAGIGDPVFWFTVRPIVGAIAASLATGGSIIAPIFFFVVWNAIRIAFLWHTQQFGYKQGTAITSDLGGGMLQQITKGASILGMFILGVLIQRWVNISFTGPNNAMLPSKPLADGAYVGEWIDKAGKVVVQGAQTGTTGDGVAKFDWLDQAGNVVGNGVAGQDGFAHYVTVDQLNTVDGSTLHNILGQVSSGLGLSPEQTQSLQDVFNSLIPAFIALLLTFLVLWILRKWGKTKTHHCSSSLVCSFLVSYFTLQVLLNKILKQEQNRRVLAAIFYSDYFCYNKYIIISLGALNWHNH